MADARTLTAPFAEPAADVLAGLDVRPDAGLSESDVVHRRDRYGANQLRQQRPQSIWTILFNQFKSLIVLLLLAAVVLSAATADWLEAIAIGIVIVLNAAIGFGSELRAIRSMEALRRLGEANAAVRRDGAVRRLPAAELVPGDIVIVDAGNVVTADLRIIVSSKLQADESTLTGESVPVEKDEEPVPSDSPLAERRSMLFKGTAVTQGSAECVVCATGMATELGRISALTEESPDQGLTPLERRLGRLGRKLVWLTLIIAAVVALAGIFGGRDPSLIVKTSIALAVAAVPEGLPIVATLALARGMWRMARQNALVNRLAAVETLGATTVILTDKTGTLTENRMTVREIATAGGAVEVGGAALDRSGEFKRNGQLLEAGDDPPLRALLESGVLCSNASWDGIEAIGDPMEVALIVAAAKAGFEQETVRTAFPEVEEIAFDPAVNMMATYNKADGSLRVAVKGAPEAVLAHCTHIRVGPEAVPLEATDRDSWLERNRGMADSGHRVLALAENAATAATSDPYSNLTFLGLVGLVDPPRTDVQPAIVACQDAGVRVVMVTGDHPATARNVAAAVGLASDGQVIDGRELNTSLGGASTGTSEPLRHVPIFARVSPEQKLDLIRLYQNSGEVVAMLGDGVNDAPALRSADIGVAMGQRGTDVAREAADMVLRDDSFASIVTAVRQGRVIFDNIRSFIRYLISCNLSEIIVVLLGVAAQTPLPILPLQILFLNLITDVFPAIALGLGEGDPRIMDRPPRDPKEPILTRYYWIENSVFGFGIALSVLAALLVALHGLHLDERQAVTVSFLTLAFAQLWHVFNMRRRKSSPFKNQVTVNRYVWMALALCVALIVAAVYLPWLAIPLDTVHPGSMGWLVVGLFSVLPTVVAQAWLTFGPSRQAAHVPGSEGTIEPRMRVRHESTGSR